MASAIFSATRPATGLATQHVAQGTSTVTVTARDASGNTRTNTYQVSDSTSGATYVYDANGSLTAETDASGSWSYGYDAENRLTQVVLNNSQVASFAYDPLGRRIRKTAGGTVTSYTYDGQSILQQSVPGVAAITFVQGPGIDEPLATDDGTSVSYSHTDALGSVVKTTSATGAVTLTRQYDTWGTLQLGATGAGYAFTGREWDPETNLYYYRARYYDPKAGRFISADPIGFDGGINFYAYVWNNPIRFTDPLGLCGPKQPCQDPECVTRAAQKFQKCLNTAYSTFESRSREAHSTYLACFFGPKTPQGVAACLAWVTAVSLAVEFDFKRDISKCDKTLIADLKACSAGCR